MKVFQNKTARLLAAGLTAVVLLCLLVFSSLAVHMNQQSTQTINEVGTLYMSSMSQQISMHFETTIRLRLDQLEVLTRSAFFRGNHEDPALRQALTDNARARDFSFLAFCSPDGRLDMLYGSSIDIIDPEPFLEALNAGERKVTMGTDSQGGKVILLGASAGPADVSGSSAALVAGLPVSYISETLSLNENDEQIYSFIIRQDGTFVIQDPDALYGSYFQRVLALYNDVEGKTPQQYLEELTAAMAAGETYSSEFRINGERRHLYCAGLAYSDWYLITFMPYDTMDSIVNNFSNQWRRWALGSGGAILLALLAVFVLYFHLTHQQLEDLEKARQEAEHANKAKSEFLSNMSHDIRTPMNAIVGMTAIATANLDDRDQVQNCLKKITLSSRHLLSLINDVLDMSKIESGRMTLSMELVSLREVLDGIVSIVQPQLHLKNQQFNIFIHDIITENVYCDSVRLNQVLLNFLSNAIKFTPNGGCISVTLYEEPSPMGEDFVRTHIEVTDNGIGMAPDFVERIFDSFVREDTARIRKTEGTGLGMAIAKYIIDAMEGTIQVQSTPGEGSTFHVTLDLEKADVPEAEMILPNWNMLVVDDDRQLCESAVSSLESIGVRAEWTLDGESAVEMVEKRYRSQDEYHIILLDWKLPGIDGIETARRIRKRLGEDVPIMLISAYDWSEIEQEARAAGITGFISKPLFKSTLYHGLKQFAGERTEELITGRAEKTSDFTGRRVLIAEDNELNWEIANELLSAELHLTLDWAENGQLCVEMLQKSAPGYYDAVLMDIRMPVMTGYEATEVIRGLDRPDLAQIPIIAMTADAFAEDAERCLECGMNAHVAKPIDVREVARLLEKFVDPN